MPLFPQEGTTLTEHTPYIIHFIEASKQIDRQNVGFIFCPLVKNRARHGVHLFMGDWQCQVLVCALHGNNRLESSIVSVCEFQLVSLLVMY